MKPRLSDAEYGARQRLYQKRWRAAHPNANKKWRKRNKKRVRDLKRAWRAKPANAKREKAWTRLRKLRARKARGT
jgi:hypothetical protein